ncbi:MAG: hypothetical protein ACLGSD_12345 [Acidobacteriota bacterium]
MRSSVLPGSILAAALTAASLFAQSGQQVAPVQQPAQATHQTPAANRYIIVQPQPCPVADMHATQGSSSQMLRTNDGKSTPMMRPKLTLTPHDGRKIVAATVTAHGYPPTPGTLDLVANLLSQPTTSHNRQIAKTLAIKFHADDEGGFSAELPLRGFSAVTMIDLNSVTYSDGSVWKVAKQNQCRVAPDPLLLIATQ